MNHQKHPQTRFYLLQDFQINCLKLLKNQKNESRILDWDRKFISSFSVESQSLQTKFSLENFNENWFIDSLKRKIYFYVTL